MRPVRVARNSWIIAIILCLPRAGAAQVQRGVLLLDRSAATVDPELRRQVLGGLQRALEAGGFTVEARPRSARGAGGAAGAIDALLKQAKTHSEQFEEQKALATLERAEQLVRAGFGDNPRVKPLMRVLMARVKLAADAGNRDDLEQTLTRVLVLQPGLTLDPGVYPPKVIAAAEQIGHRVDERTGELRVTSAPPGYPVLVDGRPRGVAPATVKVPLGEHFVAVGPRGGRVGRIVRVGSGGAGVTVAVRGGTRQLSDRRLRNMGQQASAGWVVTVRVVALQGRLQVRARAVAARTVDVPRELRSAAVTRPGLGPATRDLGARLQQALHGSEAVSTVGPPGDDDGSIFKTWWFWTIVGVVAGGGAATAVVLTRDSDPGVRVTVQR
jgi:hypothetical protein